MVLVVNLTARAENSTLRVQQVNTMITSGYAQAVHFHNAGRIEGEKPEKFRLYELNNTDAPAKTLYVNASYTEKYASGQIDAFEYTDTYWRTVRNMTAGEKKFATDAARNTGNVTYGDE